MIVTGLVESDAVKMNLLRVGVAYTLSYTFIMEWSRRTEASWVIPVFADV